MVEQMQWNGYLLHAILWLEREHLHRVAVCPACLLPSGILNLNLTRA